MIGLGRLEEIQPLLDEVEGLEPETGWFQASPALVYRNVAAVLARFGLRDQARETAERAVAWYTNRNPDGYRSDRARALFLAERPEEALGLLIPLVEDYPESLRYRGDLGIALALTGDEDGAEAQARWIEESDSPSVGGSHAYSRAVILAHLDRKDEAVRLLRQALNEGWSHYDVFASRLLWCDPHLMPLWGYEPFEQLIAPKG